MSKIIYRVSWDKEKHEQFFGSKSAAENFADLWGTGAKITECRVEEIE